MPGSVRSLMVAAADQGTGVPSGNNRVRFSRFHEIDGAADRGIFLATDAVDGSILHLHHLRGMADGDTILEAGKIMPRHFGTDFLLVAHEDGGEIGIFAQGLKDAGHGINRGEIPAHGIEGDPHRVLTRVNSQNLALLVVAARWAGNVRAGSAAALWAFESFGACQRLAALRVRRRIFEVLRLGTPRVKKV